MDITIINNKIKTISILGIIAALVSILTNWPNDGRITTTVIFLLTGIVPLFFMIIGIVSKEKHQISFVYLTWINIIGGISLLTVAAAPSLATGSYGTLGNGISSVIYIVAAVTGFLTAMNLKIDMVP